MITFKEDVNNEDKILTWRYYKYNGQILMVENKKKELVKLLVIVDPNEHYIGIIDHTINVDSMITPSVVCPIKGCTFHDFIKLEGL